jgi:hypothetical protein
VPASLPRKSAEGAASGSVRCPRFGREEVEEVRHLSDLRGLIGLVPYVAVLERPRV